MFGGGMLIQGFDQRGAKRGTDHIGEPHFFVVAIGSGSRNTRSRPLAPGTSVVADERRTNVWLEAG